MGVRGLVKDERAKARKHLIKSWRENGEGESSALDVGVRGGVLLSIPNAYHERTRARKRLKSFPPGFHTWLIRLCGWRATPEVLDWWMALKEAQWIEIYMISAPIQRDAASQKRRRFVGDKVNGGWGFRRPPNARDVQQLLEV